MKLHRAIQQWDRWLTGTLGQRILNAEQNFLPHLLGECYGKYALLIGVPGQERLLKFSAAPWHILLSPMMNKNHNLPFIEADFYKLPIMTASMDVVLVPHSLELVDNPRRLLSEACRVVKPQGYIIIYGFNPYSLWGWHKKFMDKKVTPWTQHFIPVGTVKKWLAIADFELIKHETLFFRPPLQHHEFWYSKIKFMEWVGPKFWPFFGGVYMLMAKAKVVPLTPIKLQWKQHISGIQASFPSSSIRNSQ